MIYWFSSNVSVPWRYEKDGFNTGGGGGSADYAYMLIFGLVCIEASLLLLFYQPFLMFTGALRFYIIYVWSRKNPGQSVSFWGIPINALHVPWVMIALRCDVMPMCCLFFVFLAARRFRSVVFAVE